MAGLFVTGTGTDVGKTYVTALWIKRLREAGFDVGYYKAAVSGAPSIGESDAGFVNKMAHIGQEEKSLLTYLYDEAVSPHLAAKHEGPLIDRDVVNANFHKVAKTYPYVTVEGSGGIICPLRDEEDSTYLLEDVIKDLHLPAIIVAHAGLGTINSTVLTVEYMRARKIDVKGVILNYYKDEPMEEDNRYMIEKLAHVPVLGVLYEGEEELNIPVEMMIACYQ